MSAQLTESFEDLTEWAKKHGPEHLRYAAERGFTVKAGAMDVIAERVAREFGGRCAREEDLRGGRFRWAARATRDSAWESEIGAAIGKLDAIGSLPAKVKLEMTGIAQRIEEQTDLHDPKRILKYTGLVITVSHPATENRYVVINLESSQS